ncbi:hypothetical protein [Vibrio diazotrophicus]|uniref:hypothetical protein n=1 Tax=Vibrio diazotrophicus TaxID=685 RepID=UPI0011AF3446|nr:hypothetical protein [Vibrio diazotrophicus]
MMKKILLTVLVSLCLGILLNALHLAVITNGLVKQKIHDFNNFISVFDAARDKLHITASNIQSELSKEQDASIVEKQNRDVKYLFNDNTIDLNDVRTLDTLTQLYNSAPEFVNSRYVNALSYLSFHSKSIFYSVKPTGRSTYKEEIKCSTSEYCSFLYDNSKSSTGAYTYDIFENTQAGGITLTLSTAITHNGEKTGSLVLDIPVNEAFNTKVLIEKKYENGKNIYVFSTTKNPLFNYHENYNIDQKNILRLKVSYLELWLSKAYLTVVYSLIIFCIIFMIINKRDFDKMTMNMVERKEAFYDEGTKTYRFEITKTRHLEDVVNGNEVNSLILIKYDLDEAKEHNAHLVAQKFMVDTVSSFIRASDYLIKNPKHEDELIMLLPKCSTENATKILNKVFYNLNEETYSDKKLKLKATRVIANLQNTASIDNLLSIAQKEVIKEGNER